MATPAEKRAAEAAKNATWKDERYARRAKAMDEAKARSDARRAAAEAGTNTADDCDARYAREQAAWAAARAAKNATKGKA